MEGDLQVKGPNTWISTIFIVDLVGSGMVRVEYCPTNKIIADFNTKPLQCRLF